MIFIWMLLIFLRIYMYYLFAWYWNDYHTIFIWKGNRMKKMRVTFPWEKMFPMKQFIAISKTGRAGNKQILTTMFPRKQWNASSAVIWPKYRRYSVKHHIINQTIYAFVQNAKLKFLNQSIGQCIDTSWYSSWR